MTTRSNMLPSALLEEPGAKRTARDWLVDLTMLLVAIGIGLLAFEPTEDQHSELMALIDVLCGVVGWIALWWRRRWPVAVAVLTLSLSTISAFVAGAALIALFNVALRSSRRALVADDRVRPDDGRDLLADLPRPRAAVRHRGPAVGA